MVFLGFGKYARADKVYALEPLVGDERGGGRRTRVWVEGIPEALVASRTERTILHDMGMDAGERSRRARPGARSRRAAGGGCGGRAGSISGISGGERGGCSRRRRARRRPSNSSEVALPRSFFARDVHEVARELVGATLLVDGVGGSSSRRRRTRPTIRRAIPSAAARSATRRCSALPGHAYVYRSYGIHHCLNLVCGPDGDGCGRAAARAGAHPRGRRDARAPRRRGSSACSAPGPGRLCRRWP